jgi:hypothetical protein
MKFNILNQILFYLTNYFLLKEPIFYKTMGKTVIKINNFKQDLKAKHFHYLILKEKHFLF